MYKCYEMSLIFLTSKSPFRLFSNVFMLKYSKIVCVAVFFFSASYSLLLNNIRRLISAILKTIEAYIMSRQKKIIHTETKQTRIAERQNFRLLK